ncbi:hypothetical protein IH575_00825 [Candidatus Dojkabacteria bacterium]|nr:hypothetical protein [Candidatus Dojkabacteria bacterium]
MSEKEEWKKSLENEIEHYDDYLKKAKDITDLVSDVEQKKEEAETKLLFVNSMPEPILSELGGILFVFQKHDEEQLKLHLPVLPTITPETSRYMSTGTSTSSGYFDIIQTYRHSDAVIQSTEETFPAIDPESVSKVYIAFTDLADKKSKKTSLPPVLDRINKDLGSKFIVAQQSYEKAKNGIVGIDQSAIQLRDILEQLWGGLVNLVRQKDPRKYKGSGLNLDTKGKAIVVANLATDEINAKKLTLLLETVSTIKYQLSETNFGKNPLTKDLDKLTKLYNEWMLVVTDIADFVSLNLDVS